MKPDPPKLPQSPSSTVDADVPPHDSLGDLDTDPAVLSLVRRMLAAEDDVPSTDLSGEPLGRFLLMERIGAGAMGEVYSAYDEQLDRKVAVKLVNTAVSVDADMSQRLLREAKTLARLSHPNVVQVYEAGTFRGRVYVAMEFIRGVTLGQWIDDRRERLDASFARDVLDMYIPAGRGLLAAHRAGLVHRDFKPANALVGDDGRVRVVDFGLARSQLDAAARERDGHLDEPDGPDGAVAAKLTHTGAMLGTPAYMSPEQWQARPVDARSDQFSFCVALYEALYGRRPVRADSLAQLSTLTTTGAIEPPPRKVPVPKRVWPILERGLAVAADDRYPDMQALLAALSWSPARRRRWLATVAAIGAVALASVILTARLSSTTGGDPCRAAGANLERLWNPTVEAQLQRAFVATGLPYAKDTWHRVAERLDRYATVVRAQRRDACEAVHVRKQQTTELFDRRSVCLDRRERHFGALVAGFSSASATLVEHSVSAVADLPSAEGCDDAEALLLGARPPGAADKPKVAAIRAELARAMSLYHAVRYQDALAVAEAQLPLADDLTYRPVQADVRHTIGRIQVALVTREQAARVERTLLDAVGLAERSRYDERAAESWVTLARLASKHHTDKGLGYRWLERAMAAIERAGAGPDLEVRALLEQGRLETVDVRYTEATETFRRAIELGAAPGVSAIRRVDAWHLLAAVLDKTAAVADAGVAFESAIALSRAAFGDQHPRLTWLEHDFARHLRETGAFERARTLLERALQSWVRLHDPAHPTVGRAHLDLATLERAAGALDAAERHARAAQDIYERALAEGDARRARPHTSLAITRSWRRDFAGALASYERALAIQTRAHGADSVRCAYTHGSMADALLHLGRIDEAERRLGRLERAIADRGVENRAARAFALKLRGLLHLQRGHAPAAIAPLQEARGLLLDRPGRALDRAEIEWALARARRRAGDWPSAHTRALAESARAIYADSGALGDHWRQAIDDWLQK